MKSTKKMMSQVDAICLAAVIFEAFASVASDSWESFAETGRSGSCAVVMGKFFAQ